MSLIHNYENNLIETIFLLDCLRKPLTIIASNFSIVASKFSMKAFSHIFGRKFSIIIFLKLLLKQKTIVLRKSFAIVIFTNSLSN